MEHHITSIISHISKTQREMAKIVEVKRDIVVHMSKLINAIPDSGMTFTGISNIAKHSMQITENIAAYLNSIAELEEAMADHLDHVMKECRPASTEEEE